MRPGVSESTATSSTRSSSATSGGGRREYIRDAKDAQQPRPASAAGCSRGVREDVQPHGGMRPSSASRAAPSHGDRDRDRRRPALGSVWPRSIYQETFVDVSSLVTPCPKSSQTIRKEREYAHAHRLAAEDRAREDTFTHRSGYEQSFVSWSAEERRAAKGTLGNVARSHYGLQPLHASNVFNLRKAVERGRDPFSLGAETPVRISTPQHSHSRAQSRPASAHAHAAHGAHSSTPGTGRHTKTDSAEMIQLQRSFSTGKLAPDAAVGAAEQRGMRQNAEATGEDAYCNCHLARPHESASSLPRSKADDASDGAPELACELAEALKKKLLQRVRRSASAGHIRPRRSTAGERENGHKRRSKSRNGISDECRREGRSESTTPPALAKGHHPKARKGFVSRSRSEVALSRNRKEGGSTADGSDDWPDGSDGLGGMVGLGARMKRRPDGLTCYAPGGNQGKVMVMRSALVTSFSRHIG